jgi:hypothetical protein
VTPLVAFLASGECTVTQHALPAMLGRYARGFVGVSSGWHGPREAPAAAEDMRDHLAEIEDLRDYFVPNSVFDQGGTRPIPGRGGVPGARSRAVPPLRGAAPTHRFFLSPRSLK